MIHVASQQQVHDHNAGAPWERSRLEGTKTLPPNSSLQGYHNRKSRGCFRHCHRRGGIWGSDPGDVYSSINYDNLANTNTGPYHFDTDTMHQGYNGPGPSHAFPGFDSIVSRKNRSLPLDILTRMLSKRAGHQVEAGNILSNLYAIFTDKASVTCKAVVKTVLDALKVEVSHELHSSRSRSLWV